MVIFFQVIIAYLLLLLLTFVVPKLRSILYTATFFLLFFVIFKTIILPFSKTILTIFDLLETPFIPLLIGSAILYFISDTIAKHMKEAGYASFAEMAHFSVKVTIILLWMNDIQQTIELLAALITSR